MGGFNHLTDTTARHVCHASDLPVQQGVDDGLGDVRGGALLDVGWRGVEGRHVLALHVLTGMVLAEQLKGLMHKLKVVQYTVQLQSIPGQWNIKKLHTSL